MPTTRQKKGEAALPDYWRQESLKALKARLQDTVVDTSVEGHDPLGFKKFFNEPGYLHVLPKLAAYPDQDSKNIQLLWPGNAVAAVACLAEPEPATLACLRLIRFKPNKQEGQILIEWLFTAAEATAKINSLTNGIAPIQKALALATLNGMGPNDLLLSNYATIEPTGSLRGKLQSFKLAVILANATSGPAIELKEDDSQVITHFFDHDTWEVKEIAPRPVSDFVRPIRYNPKDKKKGAKMRRNEFYNKYGQYACAGGRLTEDMHLQLENPSLVLKEIVDVQDEEETIEKLQETSAKNAKELDATLTKIQVLEAAMVTLKSGGNYAVPKEVEAILEELGLWNPKDKEDKQDQGSDDDMDESP